MYIHEKRVKTGLFVVATFFLIFLWNAVSKSEVQTNYFSESEFVNDFCQNESQVCGLYHLGIDKSNECMEILIRWWESEGDSSVYFFLPSGSYKQKYVWAVPNSMAVSVEGEKIVTGKRFDLPEGEYKLTIERDNVKKDCVLRVLESSATASLFLELETADLEYIHTEKGNAGSGRYVLFNSAGIVESTDVVENFRGRGNVSWVDSEKKGYQITLGKKKSLLGMPAEKQWILISNTFDDTLIRNRVCNDIAYGLGLAYTPKCEYIDLYIGGEYRGNYLLSEKVEIGENRISINKLEKENEMLNEEIELSQGFRIEKDDGLILKGSILENESRETTGGYLLELETPERFEREQSGFITSRGQCVTIQSPKYASEKQVAYIAERYQCFENAIYSSGGCCPKDGKSFMEYIDLESFAKKYLLEELSKNHDAHITSQFFYKPEDVVSEKIFAGPAWDYDKALGIDAQNYVGLDLKTPDGIHVGVQKREHDIWYGLYCQEEFLNKVQQIFEKELVWIVKKEARYVIPDLARKNEASVKMNHIRWNVYEETSLEEKMKCYERDVLEICEFLENRMNFLENEWKQIKK